MLLNIEYHYSEGTFSEISVKKHEILVNESQKFLPNFILLVVSNSVDYVNIIT